jgi:thiol-disulfide isomerase/thioredoxin
MATTSLADSTPTRDSDPKPVDGLRTRRAVLGGISVLTIAGTAGYAAVMASRAEDIDAPVPITFAGRGGKALAAGSTAPDFALPSLDGSTIKLSDYRGRPVWINVWASWCPPCRAELPDIAVVSREYVTASETAANTGLAIILISIGEEAEVVRKYVATTKINLPVIVDQEYRITENYRVSGMPTHFFIGPDGHLKDFAIGGLKPRAMRTRLDRLLERTPN